MKRSHSWLQRGVVAAVLGALTLNALPTHASGHHPVGAFASPRFLNVWRDADQAVADGRTSRSWTWGSSPWFDYKEFYQQSPNGLRLVQYFEKARMEINNPADSSGPLAGVTNGLLPVEMVSGRVKLSDSTGPEQNEQREPAAIPVAGDSAFLNQEAPTYASFRSVATVDNGYRDQNKVGQRVSAQIGRDGSTVDHRGTDIVVYESVTGHNCINQYPSWLPDGSVLVYESNCLGGNFEIYRAELTYTADTTYIVTANPISPVRATRLTNNNTDDRYPRMSPDGTRIVFTATRDGNAEIYVMNSDGGRQARLTFDGTTDQAPTWSLDNQEIVFASNHDGDFQLYKLTLVGGDVQQLTANTVEDNWPIWMR